MPTTSAAYPIIFTITQLVSGAGFLAGVKACGKALMVLEDDGAWWLYGAEPGGIAESGDSPQEAFLRFSETFKKLLSDHSAESTGFEDFSRRVESFFGEASDQSKQDWDCALDAIRSGKLTPEPPFSQLSRQPAETPTFISVDRLPAETLTFTANRHEDVALPSAA